MKQSTSQSNSKKNKNSLKERLDLYGYDHQLEREWKLIKKEGPEYFQLFNNYDDLLVNQAQSKIARINNLKTLRSLTKILNEKQFNWNTLTRSQVNKVISHVMQTWADPEGRETWHTAGHKKFLMQFVRWIKTGRRLQDKKFPEPEEIIDISIKKVTQKLSREDLLTIDEEKELIAACGDNLRDKALLALHIESGSRAGETLNIRIGHITFLQNGGAIINVDGKTGNRPIHVLKSVPHLLAWLEVHPFKDDKTVPYWYNTGNYRKIEYLNYAGARAVIKRVVKRAIKIASDNGRNSTLSNKRIFFTLMRHGEITKTSKWMTSQLSKKRHGWSPNSRMLDNYEHLVHEDVGDAVFEHYGLEKRSKDNDEDSMIPKTCPICKKLNTVESKLCAQCGKPLDLKTAIELEEKEKEDLSGMFLPLLIELAMPESKKRAMVKEIQKAKSENRKPDLHTVFGTRMTDEQVKLLREHVKNHPIEHRKRSSTKSSKPRFRFERLEKLLATYD